MCEFKSAIVVKDEKEKGGFRLLLSPFTESHSELLEIFNLKDGARLNFARVEFSPDDISNVHLVEKYQLKIDEERTPDWFDSEMKEKVIEKMSFYIESIILKKNETFLFGKQVIVSEGIKVNQLNYCNVILIGGTIANMRGGTIANMRGGTITDMWGGTITDMWGGTITNMRGGTITDMRGGTITDMWGGTITNMLSGTITNMRGGTITNMRGGTITDMWGGTITNMLSGTITNMLSGKITDMQGGKITKDNRKK